MSFLAFLPKIDSNSSARISPVPGLFTHKFSLEKISPFLISLIETILAKANLIVGNSSSTGPLEPPLC